MAKIPGKATVQPSVDGATQLTLEQLLDQQPNQPVEWEFVPEDIGGDLIGIISKGLYPDPLDCIREYVQNSVDGKAKNVVIKITGNSVIIRDDGMGMAVGDLRQARQLGISNKSQAENVGFRGIGIYSGFDICNRLLVTTKRAGEAKAQILEFRFGEMKAQLKAERDAQLPRTPLTKLITKYTDFRQEDDQADRQYTIVQLEELSKVHIGQLSDHAQLRAYMLHNLPIDFADHFPYKDQINSQLENHVPGYNAIRVKLVTDFAPPEVIVKPNIPNLSEPIMGIISTTDGKPVAYYWACYHEKGGVLPDEYEDYRGLVYKVKGFTIGDRDRLREYFPTARGTLYYWCTGEVYVIDDNVTPNAARNDFEVSPEKLQLETAVGDTLRGLNAKVERFQERNNADKEFEKARNYLDEVENKIASFNPKECKEAHQLLVKSLFSLPKKQKKTKLDANIAQEIIRRTETLRDRVRQMIDQPDKPTTQPVANRPSPANTVVPTLPPSPRPASSTTKPASAPSTFPSESVSSAVSLKPPVLSGTLPEAPEQNTVPLLQPTKTIQQIFEQSGFDIGGSCTQLLQIIDGTLSSILTKETYERVLGDLEERLEYEVTGEIESEDE
jgi:Histidine kinase-, DNA gyrase B-, and HSP90-like ATPase